MIWFVFTLLFLLSVYLGSKNKELVIDNLEIGWGIKLGRLECLEPSLNAVAVDNKEDIGPTQVSKLA